MVKKIFEEDQIPIKKTIRKKVITYRGKTYSDNPYGRKMLKKAKEENRRPVKPPLPPYAKNLVRGKDGKLKTIDPKKKIVIKREPKKKIVIKREPKKKIVIKKGLTKTEKEDSIGLYNQLKSVLDSNNKKTSGINSFSKSNDTSAITDAKIQKNKMILKIKKKDGSEESKTYLLLPKKEPVKKVVIKREPVKKVVIKREPKKADKKVVIKREPKKADKKVVIKRKPNKLQELEKDMNKLIQRIKTEDYYKKYGGNKPKFNDGGELVKKYLKEFDKTGKERKDSLIVKFNEAINKNLGKEIKEKNAPAKPQQEKRTAFTIDIKKNILDKFGLKFDDKEISDFRKDFLYNKLYDKKTGKTSSVVSRADLNRGKDTLFIDYTLPGQLSEQAIFNMTSKKIKTKKDEVEEKPQPKKSNGKAPAKKQQITKEDVLREEEEAKPQPAPKEGGTITYMDKKGEDVKVRFPNFDENFLKKELRDLDLDRQQFLQGMYIIKQKGDFLSKAVTLEKLKKIFPKNAVDGIVIYLDKYRKKIIKKREQAQGGAKAQPKKSQAQQRREEKAQEEAQRDEFEKSGKIPFNKLDDFYKTIDNIAKGKSRRKEKQFTDVYGRKLLDDVFEGQFGRDFYSTPIKCLDAVEDSFKLSRGANHVLEVSAGLGAMLYWNMEADDNEGQEASKYTAIEINPKFTKFLKGSFGNRVKVEEGDFFTKSEKYIKPMKGGMNDRGANDFDFILCNPPFSLFRDGKNNKKAYLEFLWRSVKILQQSSKTYEKTILFISPALDSSEDLKGSEYNIYGMRQIVTKSTTIDPYKVWNLSSKPVQKRIQKENNWTDDDIEMGDAMPSQIELVGKCADFGGTGINASIYNIIVY